MIGTYCLYVEFFNLLFELGSNAIFDPAILCVSFFVVEELPLAVLRWVIRDFTEKPVDFLGYSTSIIGLISPLGRIFVLTIKCCCCDCCKDEKEPIVKWENKWCKGFAIVVTGIIVFIFNLLNWFDVASGVKSCEWTYIEVIFIKYLTRSTLLLPLHHYIYIYIYTL